MGGRGSGDSRDSSDEDGSGDDSKSGSADGSGDGKSGRPENPAEALLDVCESLLELEKRALERGDSKISISVIAGLMKEVCDKAFDQAEEDKKKK